MKRFIYKVPKGKLIKIFLETDSGTIRDIRITGDFFMHPEEAIENLEQDLNGTKLSDVKEKLDRFFTNVDAFGVTADALQYAILKCGEGDGLDQVD